MVTKSSKRVWIGGLAALAAVLMLVAVTDVVSAGSKDKAKTYYSRVLKTYPKTEYAETAKSELSRL